jgi:hypothetical protein
MFEMSLQIVFDSNFIRKLGGTDYLDGRIPDKFQTIIDLALEHGYLISIPRTVQIELNAWLKTEAYKEFNNIKAALQLLNDKGYDVPKEPNKREREVDIFELINKQYKEVYFLEPTIEEYFEAERRTSYRLPPLPKKKPDGEEFRDRIIWIQLLTLAKNTKLSILIASEDGMFENGSDSEEGKKANIQVVKTEDELLQWLEQKPPAVLSLIENIMLFKSGMEKEDISLAPEDISQVLNYRSVKESSGLLLSKFQLLTIGAKYLDKIEGKLFFKASVPIHLSLKIGSKEYEISREIEPNLAQDTEFNQRMVYSKKQRYEEELKHLIGD